VYKNNYTTPQLHNSQFNHCTEHIVIVSAHYNLLRYCFFSYYTILNSITVQNTLSLLNKPQISTEPSPPLSVARMGWEVRGFFVGGANVLSSGANWQSFPSWVSAEQYFHCSSSLTLPVKASLYTGLNQSQTSQVTPDWLPDTCTPHRTRPRQSPQSCGLHGQLS